MTRCICLQIDQNYQLECWYRTPDLPRFASIVPRLGKDSHSRVQLCVSVVKQTRDGIARRKHAHINARKQRLRNRSFIDPDGCFHCPVGGCVVYEPVYVPSSSYGSSYDRVWDSALGAAEDAGVKITSADRTTGIDSRGHEFFRCHDLCDKPSGRKNPGGVQQQRPQGSGPRPE